jgi:hypothetical protein
MSTLTELNNYANTNLPFTDNRSSGVILSYPQARDLAATITEKSFTLQRQIDILEVIKPTQAAVTFAVDVSNVPGATVAWDSLPSGVVLNVSSQVYTLYNINSATIWDAIKTPTISVPTDFQGSITYTCTIEFTVDGDRQTKSWEVGNYIPFTLLESAFTSTITPFEIHGGSATLTAFTSISVPSIQFALPMGEFTLACDYDVFFTALPDLTMVATAEIDANAIFKGEASMSSAFALSEDSFVAPYISNATLEREFIAQEENVLFATNIPYIDDIRDDGTFTVELTITNGYFDTDLNHTISQTGNKETINNFFASSPPIKWYPVVDTTSDDTLTIVYKESGVTKTTYTVNLDYAGTGSIETRFITFNEAGTTTFTPQADEFFYGEMDYIVVGAGGGAADDTSALNRSAGGGGEILDYRNQEISAQSYSVEVGAGGAVGVTNVNGNPGSRGGNSSFNSITAGGGYGGGFNLSTLEAKGGNDGSNTYLGATELKTYTDSGTDYGSIIDHSNVSYILDVLEVSDSDIPYTSAYGVVQSGVFDNEKLTVNPTEDIDLSGDFTIDFWFKCDDVTGAPEKIIDTRSEGTSLANSLVIDINNSKLRCFVDGTDQAVNSIASNTWYYVILQRYAASGSNTVVMEIGTTPGNSTTEIFSMTQSPAKDYSLTTEFYIGANGEDSATQNFKGKLDDFRIMNTDLGSSPIVPSEKPFSINATTGIWEPNNLNTKLSISFDQAEYTNVTAGGSGAGAEGPAGRGFLVATGSPQGTESQWRSAIPGPGKSSGHFDLPEMGRGGRGENGGGSFSGETHLANPGCGGGEWPNSDGEDGIIKIKIHS